MGIPFDIMKRKISAINNFGQRHCSMNAIPSGMLQNLYNSLRNYHSFSNFLQ